MNLANQITVARIISVPLFVTALLYHSPEKPGLHWFALGLFTAACISDALDGWLARRMGQTTELGSYIDPIADKLLLVSGFLSLSLVPGLPAPMHMPAWVTIPVISRDIVIVIGSAVLFFTTGTLKPRPIFVSKVTTVVQMATLLSALAMLPEKIRLVLYGATLLFTIWSGVAYVHMGGQALQEKGA